MRSNRGFTLVEIVVLVVIMAVTAAVILVLAPRPIVPPEAPDPGPQLQRIEERIAALRAEIEELRIAGSTATTADAERLAALEKRLEPLIRMAEQARRNIERSGGKEAIANIGRFEADKVECMNNVRNITGLLSISLPNRYPGYSGANLILYLVKKGEIRGASRLESLFCPGDQRESLAAVGGARAYSAINLDRNGVYDAYTSYAGRDMRSAACKVRPSMPESRVLICDDSEDHHGGKGLVVGLTDGSVQWRDKARDYGMSLDARLEIGEGSAVEELACLRAD